MKKFSRFIAVALALLVSINVATAQNGKVFQTKAQYLGLKTAQVHATVDPMYTSGQRDVLLEEGFDLEGTFPPAGWTQTIFNVNNTWEQSNPAAPAPEFSTIDPNSLYSALCPWVGEDQDEWLITDEINANGETPLKLIWYAGTSGGWLTAATLKCLISTDNGGTWTVLWDAVDEIDPAADWSWNKVVINLDAYAGAPFKIAWQYVGNDGDLAGVDGVQIKSGYDYLFQDYFDTTYTAGQYVALNGNQDWWTTWTNSPGGSEDAEVVSTYSSSPSNSALLEDGTDLILKLGNKTAGKYQISFKYYIPTDSAGYYNIQRFEEPGVEWAYEVFFGKTGDGYITVDQAQVAFFTYNHDEWVNIDNVIDLTNDSSFVYINGTLVYGWVYSTGSTTIQLGGVDFYAGAPQGEEAFSKTYLDNVDYIVLDEGAQAPEITVNPTAFQVVVESGNTDEETLAVGNEGQQDLNYNIVATYDVGTTFAPIHSDVVSSTMPKELRNQYSRVAIQAPAHTEDGREVVLHYDGEPASAFGNNNGDIDWNVAAVFRASQVKDYVGMDLTSVEVNIGNGTVTEFNLRVWEMGSYNVPGPGNLIVDQTYTVTPASWNTIVLDNPVKLNGQDLWVGYNIKAPAGQFVASTDDGTNYNPDGSWIATGPGWSHLGDGNPDYNLNWNIRAHLTGDAQEAWLSTDPTEGTVAPGESTDVTVTIDATNLTSGQYNGTLIVRSNDLANDWVEVPVSVAVFVGINETGEHGYVTMYPNPATTAVRLEANSNISNVEVYNAVGQLVYSTVLNSNTGSVDVSSLQNGVYFVKVNSELGTTTQKLVVK
jgi:hypothetical protein